MKIKFLLLFSFLSFSSFYTSSMENATQTCQSQSLPNLAKQETAIVDLESIKPVQIEPFNLIPQYLYENPNQVTKHKWSLANFQKLKKAVPTITKKQLKQKFQDPEAYKKAAEGYDWIYALSLLERDYLSKPIDAITVQTLKQINGALTRFTEISAGEFRKAIASWKTKPLTPAEHIFYYYLDAQIESVQQNSTVLDYDAAKNSISVKSIIELLKHYQENRGILCPNLVGEIDCLEPISWALAGGNPVAIYLEKWFNARIFVFPTPEQIEPTISKAIGLLQTSMGNPIKKAALLWYWIVKIHPWSEANKRTGRAIASLILLQHGYLPPLITQEEEQEYVKLFVDGFADEEHGLNNFVQFIARQIIKTQATFGAQSTQIQ
jgi:hypothetical protein